MKLAFVIMTEFLKHQQVYTLLKLVEAARVKQHEITGIFFFGTGVLNIVKKNHLGASTRNIPETLSKLRDVPMFACQTWADNYGVFPDNVVEGITISGLGELTNLTAAADKIIVFGSHTG
jgi:sulfur relay (sulfurtransferase) complex TusBCD TusD component (DsrE family)